MTKTFASLFIRDLVLGVRLGCGEEERAKPQEVRVSVEMRFRLLPAGFSSGRLEDTICYAKISEAFRGYVAQREFALVEKLAADLLGVLRELAGVDVRVALSVHKVRPPIENLAGGVVCRLGDFE